jgi:hypothetical protein
MCVAVNDDKRKGDGRLDLEVGFDDESMTTGTLNFLSLPHMQNTSIA